MAEFKIKRGDYTIKVVNHKNKKEMAEIFRLRYLVFCRELNWVPAAVPQKESDKYDKDVVHFGVFDRRGVLVGTARIIFPRPRGFMLENEFKVLLTPDSLATVDLKKTVEITRLAVQPACRGGRREKNKVSRHLYEAMYKWSKLHHIRYWVFVLEEKYFLSLRRRLGAPLRIIGRRYEFTPGVVTLPAMVDLRQAKKAMLFHLIKTQLSKLVPFRRLNKQSAKCGAAKNSVEAAKLKQ